MSTMELNRHDDRASGIEVHDRKRLVHGLVWGSADHVKLLEEEVHDEANVFSGVCDHD